MMKIITALLTIPTLSNAQMLAGSQRDDHGCVTDGGYQWCETTQSCVRPWMTHCESLTISQPIQQAPDPTAVQQPVQPPIALPPSIQTTQLCNNSPIQLCRMLCQEPTCPSGQCALRTSNCCDFKCVSDTSLSVPSPPLPPSVPMPPPPSPVPMPTLPHPVQNNIPSNCATWFDGCNTCSIENGRIGACTMMMCFTQGTPECRSYHVINNNCVTDTDCDSEHFCRPTLNVLDSPKTCVRYSQRDETCGGMTMANHQNRCHPTLECVNTMGPMIADAPGRCLEHCLTNQHRDLYGNCIDLNCREWYDGCNTCQIGESGQLACTEKYCRTPSNHHCISTIETHGSSNELNVGDVCYRFCEDGSESTISMRDHCPTGSTCSYTNPSQMSFDTCGNRANRCIAVGH